MRPAFAVAAAVAALGISLVSLVTAITGEVEVGVIAEDPGGVVLEVTPFGAGWVAGIRPGQRVVSLTPSSDQVGWAIETADGPSSHRVTSSGANAALRLSAATGAVAALLALLALRDSRTRRRRGELSSALALVLAATPFLVFDQAVTANVVLATAGVAPALWIARWGTARRWLQVAMVGSAAMVSVGWGLVRASPSSGTLVLGDAWVVAVAAGTIVMLAAGSGVTPSRVLHMIEAIRVLDAAVVACAVLAAVGLFVAGLPGAWAATVGIVPILLYTRSRRAIQESVDRVLLAELRDRAAFRATEEERARMAREIHDDPLQAIAGVIQRLEQPAPDTEAARTSLRDVAARLRGVATELHPPVLDDLGLVPAIEAAARLAGGSIPIEVRIDDFTGYSAAERPPADAELAIYRIVQEAITNALRHSGGERLSVHGKVGAGDVDLAVTDDGVGFTQARAQAALRQGHLGVTNMRQRAAAIGATLEIARGTTGGTTVRIRWHA